MVLLKINSIRMRLLGQKDDILLWMLIFLVSLLLILGETQFLIRQEIGVIVFRKCLVQALPHTSSESAHLTKTLSWIIQRRIQPSNKRQQQEYSKQQQQKPVLKPRQSNNQPSLVTAASKKHFLPVWTGVYNHNLYQSYNHKKSCLLGTMTTTPDKLEKNHKYKDDINSRSWIDGILSATMIDTGRGARNSTRRDWFQKAFKMAVSTTSIMTIADKSALALVLAMEKTKTIQTEESSPVDALYCMVKDRTNPFFGYSNEERATTDALIETIITSSMSSNHSFNNKSNHVDDTRVETLLEGVWKLVYLQPGPTGTGIDRRIPFIPDVPWNANYQIFRSNKSIVNIGEVIGPYLSVQVYGTWKQIISDEQQLPNLECNNRYTRFQATIEGGNVCTSTTTVQKMKTKKELQQYCFIELPMIQGGWCV